MNLYLVQHGLAKSQSEDPTRSLSQDGETEVMKMAHWLAGKAIELSEIRHSGKLRALQTAEIVAGRLGGQVQIVEATGLGPMDDVSLVAKELETASGNIMIVGHLPFLERLAGLLVAGAPEAGVVRFRNAGIVCLVNTNANWSVEWMVIPDIVSN